MTIRFTLHDFCPHLQADTMGRWERIKYRKDVRARVKAAIADQGVELPAKPWRRAAIRIVQHRNAMPDYDNVVTSHKTILDAMQPDNEGFSGIFESDKYDRLEGFGEPFPSHRWVKCRRGEERVEVEVQERA